MIGVDTNIILNVLRKDDPAPHKRGSLEFFRFALQRKLGLAVSVITLTELFRKPFKDSSAEEGSKVDSFLHLIDARVTPIESDSAIEAARLIEQQGINFADALIAASLSFAGVKVFVTRNVADYRLSGLDVLTPEQFIKKNV